MYYDNSDQLGKGQQSSQSANTYANAGTALAPPPPPGIASRVQDLQKTVADVCDLAYNLRSALGIQQPSDVQGAKQANEPTLADVLLSLRHRLNNACADFRDVLQHLNS